MIEQILETLKKQKGKVAVLTVSFLLGFAAVSAFTGLEIVPVEEVTASSENVLCIQPVTEVIEENNVTVSE